MTDPDRISDPISAASVLPRGSGIIFRGYGRPEAEKQGWALAKLARRRGLILLIGADWQLAAKVGADGVHLPERLMQMAPRLRARHPDWIITTAAHSLVAIVKAGRGGLDGAVVSAVFPSRSASAGPALGTNRLALWVKRAKLPIIALGGINAQTGQRLIGTRVYGLAAIEGFKI